MRKTWSQVPYDCLNGLIYYSYVSAVLTSDISNITISISTRRTEGFGNLVLVLMLMSRLSSLRTCRYSSYNLECPPYNRETEGGKTFQFSTIKLWNSLPNNLKKENTIENFELKFKTHFKIT